MIKIKRVRLFKHYKFVCVKPLGDILKNAQKLGIAENFEQLIRKGYSIKPLKTNKRKVA